MAKIELLFGGPIAHDEEISVENYAYNWDVSIETAVIRKFKSWISYLSIKSDDKDNTFFELLLFIGINQMLKLPKITSGTYSHKGFVLPKIIIHGDRGVDKQTGNSVSLTESCINIIGNNFEGEIGYEYFEYQQIESGRLPQPSAYL
ncbi:hypothetical protein [Polynucleobacter hallstattensis]|jgi:hypothetical protein|uniref:hypothetical protein n=1 Tax=Polynucleobacter hallstattensis TaxID=1855586 RepID=UPI001C0B3B26|nr:hypothetical protein [Polynucleobacter hallstattensis]MBU3562034.1 hypothetical protein [Polynucleobacter hallstattensis]